MRTVLLGSSSLILTVIATIAFASGDMPPTTPAEKLQPATTYSGNTPVDLRVGLPFNNGVYGLRNLEIEKWANTGYIVANVSDMAYPYESKDGFLRELNESARFVRDAIANWSVTTELTKPEAAEYSKQAIATMQPLLDNYESAYDKAKGAGKNDWDGAQENVKRALIEMRSAYSQMHRNVK